MSVVAPTATDAPVARHTALKLAVALFCAIKIAAIFTVNPVADELYYWLWGQHPGISYYDHPPLNAWLLGLTSLVLPRSLFSLRLLTLVSFAGTAWIFYDWARRVAGAAWEGVFWRSLLVYVSSATFGIYTSLATSDHILLVLVLFSAHFFLSYFADVKEKGAGRLWQLYFGAVLLGFAGLAKYNAVFMGLGLVLLILFDARLRPLLRSPHLWLAGLIAVAMQSPILIWNLQHDFASFRFHLVERHTAPFLSRIDFRYLGEFVLITMLVTSPFFVWGMVRFLTRPLSGNFGRTAWGLALAVFAASTGTFLLVTLTDEVFWWWALLGYILIIPFLGLVMRHPVLLWGHAGFGLVMTVFQFVSTSFVPVLFLLDRPDPTRARNYGWEQIEEPLNRAVATYAPDFVAAAKWETASFVGFATGNIDVVNIADRPSQFDYWFDAAAHRGETALLVLYDNDMMRLAEARFERLTQVETIPVERFGYRFGSYNIYLAEGFRPAE